MALYDSPERLGAQISFLKNMSQSKCFPGIRNTLSQTHIKQNKDQVQESIYHSKYKLHYISSLHKLITVFFRLLKTDNSDLVFNIK